MKSKKLISLLCAAAMTTSAFAGLVTTASAATGDQLASFDFETVDWGSPSRTDKWTTTYEEFEDATKPEEVTGKSMVMNSLEGNNASVMHAITVTTSPTNSYNVDFDIRLASADYKTGQTQNEDNSWTTNDRELGTGNENFEYVYGFGNTTKPDKGDATASNMFEIRVKGDSVFMNNGSADLYDTGIDVPVTGEWFHFDVTADATNGKYKATITPYAEGAETVEVPSMSFQNATANALTAFYASSVRYDGSTKGWVRNGVIDNVVITEAENINPSNITIKYVDATSGEEIKASETVSSETGSSYTAPASKKANFTIDGDTENYYKYVAEGSVDTIESVSSDESNNVITLKFEKAALVNFTVNAVTTSGATIKQLYTKKAMPGATETFFNTIYITEAGQSYKAKDTTNYKVEATVADEGTVANVVYKKADNLVFYSEAEDFEDCMYEEGKSLDNDSRYSGGKVRVPSIGNNYTNGFSTDPVAEAGEYILSFNSHDNKRGIIVAKVSADGTVTDLTGTTEDEYFKAGAYESEPIALEAGDYFKLYCAEGKAPWGSKQINNVDYVAVTTPVEAVEPEAAVTYTKADRKATVTVTNAEDVADTVTAVLVHASYTGDVLKSVTAHDVTMNVAGDGSIAADVLFGADEAVREGDKLMVWDSLSGMKAMAAVPYVITADEADAIVTYTVTVNEAITGGTVVASVNEAEEGDTVTLTVTPNADMQLKADSLKVMNGEDAVAVTQGTAANTYTFTMPAGNVTVTAEFEAVAVEPDEITGTVTVSGTAKVGETLTAAVAGLNEGATAKYQWQANTGADDAYVNIENATAATFVVTEDLVGKTIKVVVTADGYTGTIESAATAAVVAADEEPVAAPTVETATLHDTSEAVQDEDLYAEGSYKVTTTSEDGYTKVAIAAENLKKHQNGDTPATAGYWVGAKVTAPADTKITGYYFSKDAYVEGTSQFTDCDENEISFYTNVGDADQKIWAAVKLSDDRVYVYKLDTTNVKKEAIKSAVTIAEATNGTVKVMNAEQEVVSGAEVAAGTELTIVATPEAGYEVDTIVVKDAEQGDVTVDSGKFTMPEKAVTVTVTFVYTGKFEVEVASTYVDFRTDNADTSYVGQTPVLVGAVKVSGDELVETATDNADAATGLIFSIDASAYDNKIESAKLKFDATTQGGNNTYFRFYGVYENYVDMSSDVTANNIGTSGGKIINYVDVGNNTWTYGTEKNKTTPIEIDITDMVRPDADSKVTMFLGTGTARLTEISNMKVEIIAAEEEYADAQAVVHTVYADADGAVDIGGSKYTEFGEAVTINAYEGDKFTPDYEATIDDKAAEVSPAKYTYVSGADEKTLVAGQNDIYLVYTKELYAPVTFTATLSEAPKAGVPIVVAKDGVTVGTYTTAEETGTVTEKLLPGSYTYTVAATAEYAEIADGSFEVGSEGAAVPVAVNLQANVTKYNITVTDPTGGTVTTDKDDDKKALQGETITITATPEEGNVVKAVEVTYGDSQKAVVTPGAENTYTFTMPAGDVTITVTFEVWDGVYYSEDFTAQPTNWTVSHAGADYWGPNGATINPVEGNIYAVGKGSGDRSITSPEISVTSDGTNTAKVSLDLNIEACAQDKTSNFALLGSKNNSTWLDCANIILQIEARSSGNGYFGSVKINNQDITETVKISGVQEGHFAMNRDLTGWLHLDATIHFDTQQVDIVLTRISDSSEVYNGTVDFVSEATDLKYIFAAAGKTYGGISLANILVCDPDVYVAE